MADHSANSSDLVHHLLPAHPPSWTIPGPYLASVSNAWKLWATITDRMPNEIERLHAEHGPVVRIGPNDLSFNSPEAVTSIYESGWPKGCFYAGFRNTPETGLFSETDVQVSLQRSVCSHEDVQAQSEILGGSCQTEEKVRSVICDVLHPRLGAGDR